MKLAVRDEMVRSSVVSVLCFNDEVGYRSRRKLERHELNLLAIKL